MILTRQLIEDSTRERGRRIAVVAPGDEHEQADILAGRGDHPLIAVPCVDGDMTCMAVIYIPATVAVPQTV